MIFSSSSMRPNSIRNWLVGWVARLPARVQTKLLAAFLSIVGLLIVLGAVGLQVLSGVNEQTDVLIRQQRKIAAYHQVQHDTTSQLYSISTALLLQEDRMLDAALRQLRQFGYDLDRMEFIARDEAELLAQVRQDYDRLTAAVTRVVDFIRTGQSPIPWKPSPELILRGPYRFTRNPMYLGVTLVETGLGIALNNLWISFFALPALLIVHFIAVLPEEKYLSEKFGDSYRGYLSRVRRYI